LPSSSGSFTGERIRDKIAASKKKGLWMGGFVPFGYRSKERTLLIDKDEAETVRMIFARYLELGSVRKLEAGLAGRKLRTRAFTSISTKTWGNRPFGRGHLCYPLSNPVYADKIAHKDERYDGQHEAICQEDVRCRAGAARRQHAWPQDKSPRQGIEEPWWRVSPHPPRRAYCAFLRSIGCSHGQGPTADEANFDGRNRAPLRRSGWSQVPQTLAGPCSFFVLW
jgi:hypothetical protein